MPPPQPQPRIMIGEITTYPQFGWGVEETIDPNIKEVVITTVPHGKQMRFPFSVDKLKEFGEKCSAPSVEVARALGPDGNGHGRTS